MPVIESKYKRAPPFLFNGHLETIYPYYFRKKFNVDYQRERFILSDGDFVDLDYLPSDSEDLVILCHGLEGSSTSQYMQGMASLANKKGYETLAVNFRSCSGEPNKKLRFYHHGETEDLREVVTHIHELDKYRNIYLIGFSLGGNVITKYLHEEGEDILPALKSAVSISVPCHLSSSAEKISYGFNRIYSRKFRRSLKKKFHRKKHLFPEDLDLDKMRHLKTWPQFDDYFTASIYGFKDSEEYYRQGSANNYLAGINIPLLIINALNDPFLDHKSYPYKQAEFSDVVYLETPARGGHVGFMISGLNHTYAELRALDFLNGNKEKTRPV